MYHVKNKHHWEDATFYKQCDHPKLKKRDVMEKQWLEEGSPSYIALEQVVKEKSLLSDLSYLTDFEHTGQLEVYHSLYNKFCPKRLHFGWDGMVARSQLAILDHNCGTNCKQATTFDKIHRYKQSFSKVTQNWVTKQIMEKKDKRYIKELMTITEEIQNGVATGVNFVSKKFPGNIAKTPKPDKNEAIRNRRTRFFT